VGENGEREGEDRTTFTGILEGLVAGVPGALGAVFTAGDGECVDYYCEMDPYDLKVIGAHGSLMLQQLQGSLLAPFSLVVVSGRRLCLWILPLGESYVLTLVLERRTWGGGLDVALERAATMLRLEARIS
jgi:hypothetical protein